MKIIIKVKYFQDISNTEEPEKILDPDHYKLLLIENYYVQPKMLSMSVIATHSTRWVAMKAKLPTSKV